MSEEYFSGGYYLARRSTRGNYMSPELIPERVLSASPCICEHFPDDWAIEWVVTTREERLRKAAAFGIAAEHLGRVMDWATRAFSREFGSWSVLYTLEAARATRAAMLPADAGMVIFGLELHAADVVDFLEATKPPAQQEGFAPVGETGVYECVSRRTRPADGGETVGFELLVAQYGGLACSWLCNGLEKECATRLGIRPNQQGFLDTYAEARRCAEFVSGDEVGAEPGLWLPWRVTIYDEP